jgi:hypothetical protein
MDHVIKVQYLGKKQFCYTDENNKPAKQKHVKSGETVKWKLTDDSTADALMMEFPDFKAGQPAGQPNQNPNPFNPSTTICVTGRKYPLLGTPGTSSSYNVFVYDDSGTQIDKDDPQIIFDVDVPLASGEMGTADYS